MAAFQASARGGIVHVRLNGDRVILGGRAVAVLKGDSCESRHRLLTAEEAEEAFGLKG